MSKAEATTDTMHLHRVPRLAARGRDTAAVQLVGRRLRRQLRRLGEVGAEAFRTLDRGLAVVAAEFQQLVADIKKNGQHSPIVLTADGKTIVDGINRWRACKAINEAAKKKEEKVEPKFRSLPKSYDELDIINFIISANMRRRDLSAGQKSMIGLEIMPYLEAAAKERQRKAGGDQKSVKARENRKSVVSTLRQAKKRAPRVVDQIAKTAGVSNSNVSKAKKVKASSRKLAADVAAGKISLNDAHKQVRRDEAASPVKGEEERFG